MASRGGGAFRAIGGGKKVMMGAAGETT